MSVTEDKNIAKEALLYNDSVTRRRVSLRSNKGRKENDQKKCCVVPYIYRYIHMYIDYLWLFSVCKRWSTVSPPFCLAV